MDLSRSMRLGVSISAGMHAALLSVAFFAWPDSNMQTSPPIDGLPVTLLTADEFSKIREGAPIVEEKGKASEPQNRVEKPAPEPPPKREATRPLEKAAIPPPPNPKTNKADNLPDSDPAPLAAPAASSPQDKKKSDQAATTAPSENPESLAEKLADMADFQPLLRPKPQQDTPVPKEVAKADDNSPKEFNVDQIAALLDKRQSSPRQESQERQTEPARLGATKGNDAEKLLFADIDSLRMQISKCWTPVIGAAAAEDLRVRIKLTLSREGDVDGPPLVLNSRMSPAFDVAAEEARRAVLRCAPYELAPSRHHLWREVVINFDPRELLGFSRQANSTLLQN